MTPSVEPLGAKGLRDPSGALEPCDAAEEEPIRRHLGLPDRLVRPLVTSGTRARRLAERLDRCASPLEAVLLWALRRCPAQVKHRLMMWGFRLLVALHGWLPRGLGRRGLSDALSPEAHVLSVLLWGVRLLPLTLPRLRLGLSTLGWAYLPPPGLREERVELPERGVRGLYLRAAPPSVEDAPVLLWFFGGAFFGGTVEDNRGLMARYAQALRCDVFLADYRVCPEHTIEDAFCDGCRAYEWLLTRRAPERIVLAGNSSGGGLALRVLQLAAEAGRRSSAAGDGSGVRPAPFVCEGPVPQPAGAVLLGPFVNFTVGPGVDEGNSLVRHQPLDLVVTERVYEFVQPKLAAACGGEAGKRAASPLFHAVEGLCPIFVSFSAHEVCSDDNRQLVERLRQAGNEVESSQQPYLPHAFQALAAFLPEGKQEELRIIDWIRRRGGAWGA